MNKNRLNIIITHKWLLGELSSEDYYDIVNGKKEYQK